MKRYIFLFSIFPLLISQINTQKSPDLQRVNDIFLLVSEDKTALSRIKEGYTLSSVPMLLEVLNFIQDETMQNEIIGLLENRSGKAYGVDVNKWYQWLWNQKYEPNPYYAEFKAHLYSYIDKKFKPYFSMQYPHTIRLDEIRWGGVVQDGIPPLHDPTLVDAKNATFMNDDDVIYGIALNGEFRAYPKRIVAWHEMLTENINGTHVTGVFCSLCGTMIVYESKINDRKFSFGTSGFLYRSNKLMFDKETNSLWSTYYGEPVVGIMVGQNLKLKSISVTASTWKEWKTRYPETKVLDVNTGFSRDYGEGVAYKEYFNTDRLMFSVPKLDTRIANKEEIIAFILDDQSFAITRAFLKDQPVFEHQDFHAITIGSETRIYEKGSISFEKTITNNQLTDKSGRKWDIGESSLIHNDERLERIISYPSFWFGWFASYPETELIYQK